MIEILRLIIILLIVQAHIIAVCGYIGRECIVSYGCGIIYIVGIVKEIAGGDLYFFTPLVAIIDTYRVSGSNTCLLARKEVVRATTTAKTATTKASASPARYTKEVL